MGDLTGTYVLTKVPVLVEQDASHTLRVVGSRLTLSAGGTYMATADVEASYTAAPQGPFQNTSISTGTYTQSGGSATFTSPSEFYPIGKSGGYTMTVGSTTLTRQSGAISLVYQKQ